MASKTKAAASKAKGKGRPDGSKGSNLPSPTGLKRFTSYLAVKDVSKLKAKAKRKGVSYQSLLRDLVAREAARA